MSESSKIRKQLREARRSITPRNQQVAAARVADRIITQSFFRFAKRIAFYLPNDGEIDPGFILDRAQSMGKDCFLPIIHPIRKNCLWFGRYQPEDELVLNRFEIPEPALSRSASPARTLDLIFVPLVGFDRQGNRLGMGGGFYDRTLAQFARSGSRTRLVGLAHSVQEVERLVTNRWDIAMDLIATDRDLIKVN